MKKLLTLAIANCLLLTACSDELKKETQATDSRIQQLSMEQVKVLVRGLAVPNTYEVELSWPEAQGNVRVSEHSKMLSLTPGATRVFVDSHVTGGSERSYLVEHITTDGRITASIPLSVKIPTDIFWDGPVNLTNHQKVEAERVFLSGNAVITTADKNLTIVAKELISEGGIIQSFPESAEASWERNGRAGGMITIMALKARGSLQVKLRGEGGGRGKNGCYTDPSRHPGCAGTTGGNGGTAGSLNVNIGEGRDLNVSYENKEGVKGIAGVRGLVPYGTPDAIHPPCDRDTPNGGDGQPGGKGQVCLKMSSDQDYLCQ